MTWYLYTLQETLSKHIAIFNHNAHPKTKDNNTNPPKLHQPPACMPGAAPFFVDELPLPVLIPNGSP